MWHNLPSLASTPTRSWVEGAIRQGSQLSANIEPEILGLRERNKQDKLRRIKKAAAEFFVLKGYDDTTIREVAARAGVGLGTVFVYAATKRDLLFLTVNQDLESVVDKAAAARRPDQPMLDELLHVFRGYYAYFSHEPALARLSLREMAFYASGSEARRFLKMRERLMELIDEIVRGAIERKEILTSESSSFVAWVIFAIYQVEVRRWVAGERLNVKSGMASLRRQFQLLITGLSPQRRRSK
jgi:AcrR family transcriptional regulator